MILFVSGATKYPRSDSIGHLIVPKQWNDPTTLGLDVTPHAFDNGCFTGLDEGAFIRMLDAYQGYQGYHTCRFVTVPDVVADAASTLANWAPGRISTVTVPHPP